MVAFSVAATDQKGIRRQSYSSGNSREGRGGRCSQNGEVFRSNFVGNWGAVDVAAVLPSWQEIYPLRKSSPQVGGGDLMRFTKAVLRLVVFISLDRVCDMQSQFAEFLAQGLSGDPQQAGRLMLIPAGVLQDAGEQEAVHLAMRVRVEVLSIRPESLANECFQIKVNARCRSQAGFTETAGEDGQEGREQDSSAGL